MSAKWQQRRSRELAESGKRKTEKRAFAIANGKAVDGVVKDLGPDPGSKAGGGVRVVFNMSNEHIPTFCADTVGGYKNSYDLGKTIRLGDVIPTPPPKLRELVDYAVSKATGIAADEIYFGAVEVNGSGVRFYGDYCLVLKDTQTDEWVLDRNSYDIARPPLSWNGPLDQKQMIKNVESISGKWSADLGHMLVVKTFSSVRVSSRRLTVGQISNAVLNDEDYVEVLRKGSFTTADIAEVRTSATDAARESAIADRALHGPIPSAMELLWRRRRLEAEHAMTNRGLTVRVVTAPGRIR
ncbi:hypothetical protein [Pseudomonas sp. NPDC096950]|uniref:hypothetical protein n=1 Tax=Pseudomonas sp. NPDC096950 TaxID=3364485 RepID=UPI00383B8F78